MATKLPLLDYLSFQMKCEYLSELRFLSRPGRLQLAKIINQLPLEEHSLAEWNEALCYLAEYPPEKTAQIARDRLLQALSR